MADYTASTALSANNFTPADVTLADTERIIDAALRWLGNETGRGITQMTGTAGSKTVTVDDELDAAFFPLLAMMLREAKKTALTNSSSTGSSTSTSKSVSVNSISVSDSGSVSSSINAASAINNSQNTIFPMMLERALKKLTEIEVSYG